MTAFDHAAAAAAAASRANYIIPYHTYLIA